MVKQVSKLLELRNVCLVENDEFVQIEYLCAQDSSVDVGTLLTQKIGSVRAIGMATVGHFMKYGIIPISIFYERGGVIGRSLDCGLDGYSCVHGNIYRSDSINRSSRSRTIKSKKAA